ncbi:AraC family transcriptional regulator [Pseudomonas daroniae]|uniref:AraC family transcriptional regulator n=2 Tax=Pseudomonadales TaxID=72274 RepID=A0A4Q9QFD3_9GAMM|nr:AraC family transcriptional regulator [Pseudomonas daroniae]TBU71818.1 AraC family transcriptional regulator [Pseudomonas daroniae]TBU78157.1 AraC family transcriptional regulator [Pseudomonas sp. FRB 228]TBU87973.1 AraC family transcriptional regulator [Pseudomonas daroniae]
MHRLDTLVDLLGRHAPVDGTHETPIPGVKLLRASSPTMPMPVIYAPTLCLVAQGTKRAALGKTTYRYDPAQFLVASVELPVMGSVIKASESHPYLCLQLDLDSAELSDLAIRYPTSAKDEITIPAGLTLNRTTPQLLDAAIRLVSLLDTPQDIDALASLTIREILYRLLTGPGNGVIRHMAQGDSRLNQIARAIVWIRANFRDPCRIEDAADVAGMSRSTFHLHFKAVTTMSPIEFRTHLRMQEARRLMVSDAVDAASAGFQVGYESPSQFSRDYARIFGMPPARHASQTRRQITPSMPDTRRPVMVSG